MAYPGNPELSPQAQERVMTAFRQVVTKLQDENLEEALIGLEFVLRLDPTFAPAHNLHQQLSAGSAEIDLAEVISQLQAPTTETINGLLVEAVEDFNNRDFEAAKKKVDEVLLELPGHQEARQFLGQVQEAFKTESQVGQFLEQARQSLDGGDQQEAANFVMMAQALDPHHQGIAAFLSEIDRSGGMSHSRAEHIEEPEPADEPPVDHVEEDPSIFSAPTESSELFADEIDDGAADEPPPQPPAPGPENEVSSGGSTPDFIAEEPTAAQEPVFPPQEVEFEAGGELEAAGDVADLFDAGPSKAPPPPPDDLLTPSDPESIIRDLLERGASAAADDDYASAIDAWSRVFLIDPSHEEASSRVEHIRHAKEELDRRFAPRLKDATAALEGGEVAAAKSLVDQVLAACPNHVDATRLMERIEVDGPSEDESVMASDSDMPDLEEDLFTEDTAPAIGFEAEDLLTTDDLEEEKETQEGAPVRRRSLLRTVGLAAGGVLIVLLTLWVGSLFLSSDDSEDQAALVSALLRETQALFEQNRVEEAIHLLEEFPADEFSQPRIDRQLKKFRAAMAPPTPTPVPESFVTAGSLLEEGLWMAAYEEVMAGLKAHPRDPGLQDLRDDILDIAPDAATLYSAISGRKYASAVSIAADLLEIHPDQQDIHTAYNRCLFNAAMAELRAYNLTAGERYLGELAARQPEDEEVGRVLDFISSYKSRPVDMQLEIFIRSIAER
jgi:tetratricopeptide (TPR) repeat protein